MTANPNHPCPGYTDRTGRECCDVHTGYERCSSRGPEFGLPDEKGRIDRALCGHRAGHDGPHAGYAFSPSEQVAW